MPSVKLSIPIGLIIVYILAGATILLWPLVGFMSAFAFDAPGSTQNPSIYRTVAAILAYPLLPLVGVPGSFLAYRKGHNKLAYILVCIGALPIIAVLLALIAIMVTNVVFLLGGKL